MPHGVGSHIFVTLFPQSLWDYLTGSSAEQAPLWTPVELSTPQSACETGQYSNLLGRGSGVGRGAEPSSRQSAFKVTLSSFSAFERGFQNPVNKTKNRQFTKSWKPPVVILLGLNKVIVPIRGWVLTRWALRKKSNATSTTTVKCPPTAPSAGQLWRQNIHCIKQTTKTKINTLQICKYKYSAPLFFTSL